MIWNKKKDLDKAVWVNQVVWFLRSFCSTIELLAFSADNIKLCRSRRYCSCLTHFGSIFLFMHSENIKNLWFSDVSKGYEKLTLSSTGLILIVSSICNWGYQGNFKLLYFFYKKISSEQNANKQTKNKKAAILPA